MTNFPYIHYLVPESDGLVTPQDLAPDYQTYGALYAPIDYNRNCFPHYVLTTAKWSSKEYQEFLVHTVFDRIDLGFLIPGTYFKTDTKPIKFLGQKRHPDHERYFVALELMNCDEDLLLDQSDIILCGPSCLIEN